MSKHAIADYYAIINEKLGLGKLNDHNKLHAQGLRTWMATTIGKHGAHERITGQFLGHKVKTMTGYYVKPDIAALKNEYLKWLPHLSIEKIETVTIKSDEVKEIKETHRMEIQGIKEEQEQMKVMILKTQSLHDFFQEDKETQERFKKWKGSN